MPNSLVRQYVLANDLKQGDVAKLLKSWNSLNRNWNAYLNNMDNPGSLPGLQLAYIRDHNAVVGAQDAFSEAAALAGLETVDPAAIDPDEWAAQVTAAQAVLEDEGAAQDAADAQALLGSLDAQAVVDAAELLEAAAGDEAAVTEVEGTLDPALVAAANDPGLLQAAQDVVAYEAELEAATLIVAADDAYQAYVEAETSAQDSFMAASVSYSGDYDDAMGEVRSHVDGIISMEGGLGDMVDEYDAAAGEEVAVDTSEPPATE
jgi:hypothetical protein